MSPKEFKSKPTDPKYAEHDAYMFDSRNIVESQQLSVAISRMQGLTNR